MERQAITGTYVLHEHTFSCQAGKWPFSVTRPAWRMFNKIRNQLMDEDHEPLSGAVEADETFVGGKPRQSDRNRTTAPAAR
jgi:hypothetical protein